MEQSKIVLNIQKAPQKSKKKELQRTDDWQKKRMGRFTASQFKNLMSCSSKVSRKSWNDIEKLYGFGTSSIKYLYENAMERKTKRYIDSGKGTAAMQYGTRVEPLIQKVAKKQLKKIGVVGKMKEVGFKEFKGLPNAGASSDSIIVNKQKETLASVEIKACTSWGTHFDRTFEEINDKSIDFWQIQAQMIAWNVDKCYYVVAEPPADIRKYVYHDGAIMDLYDDFVDECGITIQVIEASKEHQKALIDRIIIAEKCLVDWLEKGGNLKNTLDETIKFFQENPDQLKIK